MKKVVLALLMSAFAIYGQAVNTVTYNTSQVAGGFIPALNGIGDGNGYEWSWDIAFDPGIATVVSGASATFTVTPPKGYAVDNWLQVWQDSFAISYRLTANISKWTTIADSSLTHTFSDVYHSGKKSFLSVLLRFLRYGITYDANGGTTAELPAALTDLAITNAYSVASYSGSRTGYTFANAWTNSAGKSYASGLAITSKNAVSEFGLGNEDASFALYAVWNSHSYSVQYELGGGTAGTSAPGSANYDEVFSVSAPTRTGYAFGGWLVTGHNGDTAKYGSTANPASAVATGKACTGNNEGDVYFKCLTPTDGSTVTLTAVWTANEYTVTFNNHGATTAGTESRQVTFDSTFASISIPSKTGYDFGGYWTETEGQGTMYWDTDGQANPTGKLWDIASDREMHAYWIAKLYTVRFERNEKAGDVATGDYYDITTNYFGEFELPDGAAYVNEGNTFRGWSMSAKAEAAKYAPGASVSVKDEENYVASGVLTFYANWLDVRRQVVFNAEGGSAVDSRVVVAGAAYGELAASTWPNSQYVFAGWFTAAKGGTEVTAETIVPEGTGDIYLYAHWQAEPYYVAFNGNAASEGTMDPQEFKFDEAGPLASNAFKKVGYEFMGWATNLESALSYDWQYADGAIVSNLLAAAAYETNTLYATWHTNAYYVAFDPNGGSGEMANQPFVYDVAQALVSNKFTRSLYKFIGWTNETAVAGMPDFYADGAEVSNLCVVADGTNTLKAVWKSALGELSQAMDCTNLVWVSSGDNHWTVTDAISHTGSTCVMQTYGSAQAMYTDESQVAITNGGTLKFVWKSSEVDSGMLWIRIQAPNEIGNPKNKPIDHCLEYAAAGEWQSAEIEIDITSFKLLTSFKSIRINLYNYSSSGVTVYVDDMTWTPASDFPMPTAADKVEPSAITVENGKVSVAFTGDERFAYSLWATDSLNPVDWYLYLGPSNGVSGTMLFSPAIDPEKPQQFYKLETVQRTK